MRKSWDRLYLNIAQEMATMGTCHRRQVGCVLTNSSNEIIATGINGVPPGWDHCRQFCPSDTFRRCSAADSASGANLDGCLANHAEMNALIRCPDRLAIHTCYTTTSPCISCIKALLCTSATRIVFAEVYPHPESERLWCQSSLRIVHPHGGIIDRPREWIHMLDDVTVYSNSSTW